MIWKKTNPTPRQVIYILDQQQRDKFLPGIRAAQLQLARGLYLEGIIHPVSDIFPARLSTSVSINEITFRLSVQLYDEEDSRRKIGQEIETIQRENKDYQSGFPPVDSDESLSARELRSIYQFQRLLERDRYR